MQRDPDLMESLEASRHDAEQEGASAYATSR